MKITIFTIYFCITNYCFAQTFSEKTSNEFIFKGAENSAAAFVDVDNDGDEDLLHAGIFYKNNNEEGFSSFFTFVETTRTINAFADYNGDGFADILFGNTLYRNNAGRGFTAIHTFTETPNAISFADFNNDILSDILLTGSTSSVLYRNNNGVFTQEQTLSGGTNSTYGDIDSDGDMDIIISKNSPPYSIIYENNNTGFVSVFENILTRITAGTPNLIDFDADGDLDFFVSNILYKKNETGFSTIPISNFINYQSSWADIDNDGFADLIISGTENAIPTLKIYKNNNTAFAEITSILNITQHVVTDFDADGDLDLFFSEIGHFYENKITVGNNSPNTPQGLDASASENGEILFSWSPVSDAETPSPGLSYNLLITKNESPHSFGGIRTHSTSASLTLLPGLYYWSVFATDTRKATSKSITKIYASIHNYPAKEIGSTSFTASWSKIKNIQTYEIHISTDKNFSLYEAYTTTDTFYTVKNLLVNTQYFYRISIPHFLGQSNPVINTFQTLNAFSLSVDTIHSLGFGTANFFDADNDKDLDVLFAGAQLSTPIQSSIFYNQNSRINQGVDVGLEGVSNSINALSDFNNDGIQDVFISGRTSSGWTPTGFLYNGNAAGFTENTAHNIFSQENGNIATGDYDNDGDIDVFIGGTNAAHSRLYRNDRTSGFTNVFPDGTFISINDGYAAFGDYDNDADLDLLASNNKNIILYENKGTSGFSSFFHYTYYKYDFGNVSFVDYNNDGFLDIYVSAYFAGEGINPYYLEIDNTSLVPYTNNISERTNRITFGLNRHYYKYYIPITNYSYFYDVINNKPLLRTGYRYSLLLENQGGVSFSEIIKDYGKNVYGSTSFGDFNNNGARDLFQIGQVTVQDFISKNRNEPLCLSGKYDNQTTNSIYSGDACFSLQNDYKLCSYFFTSSRLIDDSDKQIFNFEDTHYLENLSTNHYRNTNKTHNSFGDIDNDGDLDIMIPNKLSTKIYLNNSAIKNTPPEQVNGLIASVYGAGKVAFVWQNSQDAQLVDSLSHKAYNGIDYNMYFGTSTNKNSIRSAQSHLDDGYRKISERGMIQGNIYKLENIPNGTYVWAMQAIDQGLTGGSWAMEQTVDIQNRVFFQSITFHPLAEKTFGDAPFTISATATSNLPVFFLSANTNVANVIGNTVTIVGAGETNIIAVQTGNALYYAAYPIQQLLKLKKAPQTITFPTIPTQTIGVPFVLNAYSNFLLPIQFSLSNRNYTSLQSNTVIIFQTGTFTATAFQNGNLDIRPADSVSQSLTVKFPQKITFFKISEKTYRDLPFVLQSRSSSSLPVSYSSAHTNITIQNNTVSIHGVGTASIVAFSNGNTEFFPTHTTHILTIKKARQSITFHPLSLRTLGHADSIVVLDASASSSLPISLRVSGHSVVVNANTLTIKTAGVILIEALQSGNENYETASSFQYLTVVDANKTNQTIDFAEIPNDTLQSFQDSVVIMLTATASSSLPVQYVLGASQYSLTRNPYIIREPGIYTITALQDGDSAFNPAPPVSQTFTVKRKQSIVFNPIPHKNYESTPFFINPYSLSGLDVQVSLSNNSIITLDPDYLVTVRNVGTVGITAKQRGNDEYYAADSITRILVVTKADQYFVFKPIPSKIYEDPPIILPITTNAGLPIVYSSASHLINISTNTVNILAGGGLVRITAYNTGNKFYNTLAPVSRTFSISKARQSIYFPQIENKIYGDPPIVLDWENNKRNPILYASSNTNVIRFDGNTAFILRAGSTTLSAAVHENSQYFGVLQTQTVLISPTAQVITFHEPPIVYIHDGTFVLNATSTNTLPILYASSNPNIAYITGNTVFLQSFGNVSITAYQPAVENYYYASNPETRLLTIKDRTAVENTITFPLEEIQYVDDTALLEATSSKNISVSFEIVNNRNGASQNIASFDEDSRKITFLDTGVLQIKTYTDAFLSREIKINPAVLIKTIRVKVTYHISGRVLGAENEVVSGFVILTNPTLRKTRRAELSNGYFSFRNVPSEWTFYLQAYPKGSSATSYYPTYYGSKQAIVWKDADIITLQSNRSDFNWHFRKKPKTTIGTGNGTIIGTVLLDSTENQNRILYGNFFGAGVRYPYANIFLKTTADSILLTDISRTNGEFYFTKLPAGYYRIEVDVPGTKLKNLNDTIFLPNEENILYLSVIIGKDNAVELFQYLGKRPQTIHFPPIYKYFGEESFPIPATATSGLPLTFSSSSSLISIDRGIVTIQKVGTSIITAFQSGNEYYIPSDPTPQIMVVQKAYQSITIQVNIINDLHKFSERRVVIKAIANSGLPVQLIPSEPTIINREDTFIVNSIASFKIIAIQNGNENYHPEQVSQDIIINPNAIVVENNHIKIFPNPTNDYITIQWDKNQKVSYVKVYDIEGKSVNVRVENLLPLQLDMKTLLKGEYILVVYGEKGEVLKAKKIIKK